MKKFVLAMLTIMSLAVAGCGGGDDAPPLVVTQIVSDPAFDGDISQDSTGALFVTQGMGPDVQSVFAGIDPDTLDEFRAFLDFPLTGVGGVPGDAVIDSAFLDIFIDNVFLQRTTDTVPIQIDLVSFGLLGAADFDRQALATMTFSPPISQVDFRQHVIIDVTPLMREAQRLRLANFQVRILEDLRVAVPGLVRVNNTTGPDRGILAPLLQVTYF